MHHVQILSKCKKKKMKKYKKQVYHHLEMFQLYMNIRTYRGAWAIHTDTHTKKRNIHT